MRNAWLISAAASLVVLGAATPSARAGGYDTPILYSARHIGMGGTAVSYVDDPSAMFHNPAGLQGTKKYAATLNVSPVLGNIRATPNNPSTSTAKDIESGYAFAPFFLVGGAYRFNDWLTAGLGVYPVASAGAEYKYKDIAGNEVEDRTRLVFLEAAPGVSFQLPANFTLGATYRITYVNLERYQGSDVNTNLDFKMTGINFLGFKVGLQYEPTPGLKLGLTYRHRTDTTVENDKGTALGNEFKDISTKFTLPTRFVAGARYDFSQIPLGVSSDIEYALNSQNTTAPFKGTEVKSGRDTSVPNVFRWTDAWTVRVGVEYRLIDEKLPVRLGGAWDQKTANPAYPSAFGTPPGATYIATAGLGWVEDWWQVNFAGAYRTGSGKTTIPNDAGHAVCQFCGYSGDKTYEISMIGLYLDGSVNFD